MPTRSAPSASAFATSRPGRMPPLAMSVSPERPRAPDQAASAVGIPQPANSPATRARHGSSIRCRSTSLHDVPPAPARSTAATPASNSARTSLAAMPQPTSLTTIGNSARSQSAAIFCEQSGEARVALGLQRLLQRIQVQHQRIRAEQIDESAAIVGAVTLFSCTAPRLASSTTSGASARTSNVSSESSDSISARPEPRPIASPYSLGDAGQASVDAARFGRSAGHARDEQRRRHRAPEELCRTIHVGEIDLRQRAMHEAICVEARGDALRADVALDVDAKVIRFARRRGAFSRLVVQRTERLLRSVEVGSVCAIAQRRNGLQGKPFGERGSTARHRGRS